MKRRGEDLPVSKLIKKVVIRKILQTNRVLKGAGH